MTVTARLARSLAVVALAWSIAGRAAAQQKPEEPAAPVSAPETTEQPDVNQGSQPPEPPPAPPPAKAPGEPPAPPPSPPDAGSQEPRPYLSRPPPRQPARNVDIGPDVGIWLRPADDSEVSYGAAFSYGGHARIEVLRWLGVRAFVMHSQHSVDVPRGGLGLADTEVDHPDIALTLLGIRAEPTWVVHPRLRLWTGLGGGWAFLETDAPSTSGALEVQSSSRDGVIVELSAALGATAELVPDWLTASIVLSTGVVTGQTGDIFKTLQGFDQNGRMLHLSALPEFASAHSVSLGAGLLL